MLLWCPKSSAGGTTSPGTGSGKAPTIGTVVPAGVAGNSMTIAIPSTIANNELMLLFVGCYGACSVPSGWVVQQTPADPGTGNGYIFSKIKASGDTSISLTMTAQDSHTALLVGIKGGTSVHKNAPGLEQILTTSGVEVPALTTTVTDTLNIWSAYTNASGDTGKTDVSWTPDKPRVAVVVAPISGSFYGVLSVVSKTMGAPGTTETTRVGGVTAQRSYACFNLISISA